MFKFGAGVFAAVFVVLAMAGMPHRARAASFDCSAAPAAAARVGYCLNTFDSDHQFDATHVSMSVRLPVTGYKWYMFNCLGTVPTSAYVSMTGGVATLGRGGTVWGSTLSTVGCVPQPDSTMKWVGKAFGGGEYIEATIRLTPVRNVSTLWWPAVWAYSFNSMISGGKVDYTTWPNQPDPRYGYLPELDIFEFFMGKWGNPLNAFQQTLHAWYGEPAAPGRRPCNPWTYSMCQVDTWKTTFVSSPSFFTSWHKVAALVVPATHTTKGYVNYYLDGRLTGSSPLYNRWNPLLAPSPLGKNWAFGILDADHLAVLIGGANDCRLGVESVEVWQASEAHNLTS